MIINKVVLTPEEERQHAQLTEQSKIIAKRNMQYNKGLAKLGDAAKGKPKEGPEWAAVRAYIDERKPALSAEFEEFTAKSDAFWAQVEQRYIDSFNKDTAALLGDVQEILDSITRENFIEYTKLRTVVDEIGEKLEQPTDPARALIIDAYYTERYKAFYAFALHYVRVQMNALHEWGQDLEPLLAKVRARAADFYPEEPLDYPKITRTRSPLKKELEERELSPIQKGTYTPSLSGPFFNLPDSPASNLILEAMRAGQDVGDLPGRKRQVNRNTIYTVTETGPARQITAKSKKGSITVELGDIAKFSGGKNPAKKLFVLALHKADQQGIYNGVLSNDVVTFPLQELVDIGFYKDVRGARAGFNKGADALTSIKVKGHVNKTAKTGSSVDRLEVLFTGAGVEKGQCFIRLNYALDWRFIAQYFTSLPSYYFKLSNRASDLLYYIFYLARQNAREISEKGSFNISFRAIQHALLLPSEKQTKNPQRDIKDVIDSVLEEIEEQHRATFNNTDLALLPCFDENAPITDYLDNGYLQVTLKGDHAKPFIEMSDKTAKKIEAAQKRHEKKEPAGPRKK